MSIFSFVNQVSNQEVKQVRVKPSSLTGWKSRPITGDQRTQGSAPATRDQGRNTTMTKLLKCLRNEEGATAIEYGLIAGLIAVVILSLNVQF